MNRPSIPTNFHSTKAASTFIILTWSQPTGEVVDSYNISYTCHPVRAPPIDVFNGSMSVNGFSRCYNLTGAVHESMYNISITASNMAGSSATSEIVVYTPIGMDISLCLVAVAIAVIFLCSSCSTTGCQHAGKSQHSK